MKNYEFTANKQAIFEGFYESNLFNSETEYSLTQYLKDEDIPEYNHDYEIKDFKGYMHEVAELHVDTLKDYAILYIDTDKKIISDIRLKDIWSPQYYNYSTDELILNIDFNLKALKDLCFKNNADDFNLYLKKNYTSYSGFWSFVSNNLYDFKRDYNYDDVNKDRCINVMLEYYLITCIFEADYKTIVEKDLNANDSNYKFHIYDCLSEIQMNYAEPIEDEVTA